MNKQDRIAKQARYNEEVLEDFYNQNNVRVHGDNYRHFMVKAAAFKVLQEAGHKVGTEVEFSNGKIADIFDLTTFTVYELESNARPADTRQKLDNFSSYDLADVHVWDPTEFPVELSALKDELEARLIT